MRIFVVVPTYNEAKNLRELVEKVLGCTPSAGLVIVDDNSPDGTGELADSIAACTPRVHVLHRQEKGGLGSAYRCGFEYALAQGADVVVEMDADLSHDPAVLPAMVAHISSGQANVVIGSRYVRNGRVTGCPASRRLLSRGANMWARLLLGSGIRDYTSGFVAYSKSALDVIPYKVLSANGFAYQIELKAACNVLGLRTVEVPITFRNRTHGESKLSLSIVTEVLFATVRARLRMGSLAKAMRDIEKSTRGPGEDNAKG